MWHDFVASWREEFFVRGDFYVGGIDVRRAQGRRADWVVGVVDLGLRDECVWFFLSCVSVGFY